MTSAPTTLSERDVATAVRPHTTGAITSVHLLRGSVANQNFLIRTTADDLIVKAGPRPELAAEAWACQRVRSVGVNAPEILAVDFEPHQLALPHLVMRRLPGEAVREGSVAALTEAGAQLRRVHRIELTGYGGLASGDLQRSGDPCGVTPAGPFDSWDAFTSQGSPDLEELVAAQVLPDRSAIRIAATLRDHAEAIRFDRPGVLLHADLKLEHILTDPGRAVALIDWGDVTAGDPWYDLARFSMADPGSLRALLDGYEMAVSAATERTFAAYRVIWNTRALLYELRAGGDWFAIYRARIEADLDQLAGSLPAG